MTLHVTVTPWAWVTTMTLTFQTLSPVWASSSARRSSSSSRSVVLALPCRPTTPSLVRSRTELRPSTLPTCEYLSWRTDGAARRTRCHGRAARLLLIVIDGRHPGAVIWGSQIGDERASPEKKNSRYVIRSRHAGLAGLAVITDHPVTSAAFGRYLSPVRFSAVSARCPRVATTS